MRQKVCQTLPLGLWRHGLHLAEELVHLFACHVLRSDHCALRCRLGRAFCPPLLALHRRLLDRWSWKGCFGNSHSLGQGFAIAIKPSLVVSDMLSSQEGLDQNGYGVVGLFFVQPCDKTFFLYIPLENDSLCNDATTLKCRRDFLYPLSFY